MTSFYADKRVLVTGGAGTIGEQLIRELLTLGVAEIRAVDNNESALFFLGEQYRRNDRVHEFFTDIRDKERLTYLARDVDVILHTAALKHVIVNEISPFEAVRTNVEGTSNVISAALASPTVSRVIYTSSDKAVNPTNVMGTSKLLGERLLTSAINLKGQRNLVFSSTRFGNVIGSKGSVVEIFYRQIRDGYTLTLTDERMTRFIMSIPEAGRLVLKASLMAKGGEVFITKMPVIRIRDLATAMIDILAPKFDRDPKRFAIEMINPKAGEKLYEELMTEEETSRARELDDLFMVKPAWPPLYEEIRYDDYESSCNNPVSKAYVSSTEPCLTVDELKEFLINSNALSHLETA